jgi:hypothetical protein
MGSNKKLGDIVLGNEDCKIVGRLTRLWDSKNMRSRTVDSLISVDGLIIDKDVSVFFGSSKMLFSNILSNKYLTLYILLQQGAMVQIIVPKKLEQIFRPLLAKVQGNVCVLTNLTAVDTK